MEMETLWFGEKSLEKVGTRFFNTQRLQKLDKSNFGEKEIVKNSQKTTL